MIQENTLSDEKKSLYRWALSLAMFTVFYNIGEGLISVYFGVKDETLSLLGFGIDSFVEVISGIGIWHMLSRIRALGSERDDFEKRALKITGASFYTLTIGLIASSILNVINNHKPETTFWGVVISLISIVAMSLLIYHKMKVGKALGSRAIIADANCTKTCLYLSVILLVASVGYELTGFGAFDSIGALLIAYYSFKEGREAFEKARTGKECGCEGGSCEN
ncbi:MAG: cation transporter [Ignavibacteriales bacterium]|nr:cation transporter [Ignavibacteriales bacterium]